MTDDEARFIKDSIGDEIYCQFAEECNELSQAALKMKRAKSNVNPTPKTEKECWNNMIEEFSDLILIAWIIGLDFDYKIMSFKMNRWLTRLGFDYGGDKNGKTEN